MGFRAPVAEIAFTMERIAGATLGAGAYNDLAPETVTTILAEAGRFASEVLAPLDAVGDREGARREDGSVLTPPGFREAYRSWRTAGWNGIGAPEEWGGQGLPTLVHAAVQELWNSGCTAFATGPMLAAGAIEALDAHGSPEIKARYLPRLVSGEWMATMELTEPQAGSDVGALTARAEPAGDGSYRLFGQKIFITYGDHDLTDNIVHMVLARLSNAPSGTAGISLFLVPKNLLRQDDSLSETNNLFCERLEKKLGLHASPTCVMVYEGAVGWLVGEENRGLQAMFTMMNTARLAVGIQGVGVAERAWQRAHDYATTRRQGRTPGAVAASPIIEHPDVQAMLLRMKALTAASRSLCYSCAHAVDMSRRGPEAERAAWADRAAILTPVAKAFSTDAAIEVASLGIQVHGGMGYIEETGAAQHLRDARVFAIYEGTNGIQAIDLVTRKLKLGGGTAIFGLIDELSAVVWEVQALNRAELERTGERLAAAIERWRATTEFLQAALAENREQEALAGATPYLRLFGLTAGAALLARGMLRAEPEDDEARWEALARLFAERMLEETASLEATIRSGAAALRQASEALLNLSENG